MVRFSVRYLPRTVDAELDALMAGLPAVLLEGPKGVGKTVTARRRAQRVVDLDDAAVRELISADLSLLDSGEGTVFIDEWQRYPPVWDWVRRRVDGGAAPGRFLLAGSAAPLDAALHSGAGRIVRLRMRPLALAERGLAVPSVSLAGLLAGDRPAVSGHSPVELADYVAEVVGSGLPGVRGLEDRLRRAQLDGYLRALVEHDFLDLGHRVRRPGAVLGWLRAYAAATATTASYNTVLDAATPGEGNKPSKVATIVYRDLLEALWIVEPLPGWVPSQSPVTRLTQAPKHHLADPAFGAQLLGVGADGLLSGASTGRSRGSLLGQLFESLVTMSVRVYAQAAEARVFHLRTANDQREVDLVVERPDGRVVAFEVKLGARVQDEDVRHLRWLRDRLGPDLLDAAVITTGPEAYRRADGIAVIPASLLGP